MEEAFEAARTHFRPLLSRRMSEGRIIQPMDRDIYQPTTFLRNGAARKILSEQDLRQRVLGFVVHRDGGPAQDDRDLARIRGSPGLCAILLSILTLGTPGMVSHFESRFLGETPAESDDDLPFDEHFAREVFGNEDGPIFFQKQFAFVAVALGTGMFHREYQASRRLPYLEDERIGRGAYGRVYRVKIEKGHFSYREPRSRNKDPVLLARKDFDPDPASFRAFEDEDRTLRDLVNSANCPSNIMTSICSIVCTLPDPELRLASIFFPPAICDLNTYINDERNRPIGHTARLQNIRQMLEVSRALKWLAKNLTYKEDSDRYIHKTYHHCDLKPDNIMVCQDHSASDPRACIFKIGDFGQARELQHVLDGEGNRRMQPPGVALAGREGTYRAPEIQGHDARQEVKPESDVWSFGCIFLLIIIFNYQGADAIEQFYMARRLKSPNRDSDRFCNPDVGRRGDVCNPAVTSYLNTYIQSRVGGSELDDSITFESLKYIKKHVLVRHSSRHDIDSVSEKLHGIYNRRPPVSAHITSHSNVPSDPMHCGHSPDGMVFFYSPIKAVFYEDGQTSSCREIPFPSEGERPSTLRPRSSSCAEQHLCVLSESENDINCVFHKIKNTHESLTTMRLKDVRHGVEKVAFSRGGTMLAVACGPNRDHQARVRLYRLEDSERNDVSRGRRTPSMSDASVMTSTTANSNPSDLLDRSSGRIKPVNFAVDLCFSGNGNTLYYACRVANTRTPLVRVTMWNTASHEHIRDCLIRDEDTRHQSQFLTSITPFNTRVGFLCITHQRCIVKQTLHENTMHQELFKIPDAKYLRTIIISSSDERVVILATPDGNTVEIYGGLLANLGAARKLSISNKIRFNPKEDTAFIRESANEMRICITSLRDKKTYTFDLGRLFDL